jgi:sugar/nucleoside kinase (ribokinase family)
MDIVTIGGLLVEIMRKDIDYPLNNPADLVGPFPSGDVGIFIDTAARLGANCGVIGTVGDDDFGHCLLDRFRQDGVNISLVRVDKEATTGTAFVGYFADGNRKFIYHWRHAAAGMIDADFISPSALRGVKWAHITGVTVSVNESCRQAVYKLIDCLPVGAKVSFDPNIRPEILSINEILTLCQPILDRADIFFPSKREAMVFSGAKSDDEGCRKIAGQGKLVVLKNGSEGCRIYEADRISDIPAFKVEEIDPTGAGDSFCAAFLTALNDGWSVLEAGEFANAVGALVVTVKGPMEGAPDREKVLAFIRNRKN